MSIREKVFRKHVKGLYQKLSEITCQTPEAFHFDNFELRNRELYYKGKNKSLTTEGGKLKAVGTIVEILDKEGLCELGFVICKDKVTARQAIMLKRVEEELPSASDITKTDGIELQEIMENAARSTENLIRQLNPTHTRGVFHLHTSKLLRTPKRNTP